MAQEKHQNRSKVVRALISGFPNLHVNIEHILAENDFVLVFLIGCH